MSNNSNYNEDPSFNNNNNIGNNGQYNLIINKNSNINQENTIKIMLDNAKLPFYGNNFTYEKESSSKLNPLFNKDNELSYNPLLPLGNPMNNNNNSNSFKKQTYDGADGSTNKIDYRYTKSYPIQLVIPAFDICEIEHTNKDTQHFWFATYGKLMKRKNLLKILNYYNNKPGNSQKYENFNIKEKTLIIKDFEICFYEKYTKPFIKYVKGGKLYAKLYLLTMQQISYIFSYLNRVEYNINPEKLSYLQTKGTFEIINENKNGIILPYCIVYYLGKYMNSNIYSLSNNIDLNVDKLQEQKMDFFNGLNISIKDMICDNMSSGQKSNQGVNRKLPNSKKLVKLIKIINFNFPDFSIDEIISYLIPDNKYIDSNTKINEIKNIFFFKNSIQNKVILSSMVRDTIRGISIQAPKSIITSSFLPYESVVDNQSSPSSALFVNEKNNTNLPIKDDYKFQTVNTNDKDGDKNKPFIIYVCDNVQNINFIENKNNNKNQNKNNNNSNQNNNTNKDSKSNINNSINNNKSNENIKEFTSFEKVEKKKNIKLRKSVDIKDLFTSNNKKNNKRMENQKKKTTKIKMKTIDMPNKEKLTKTICYQIGENKTENNNLGKNNKTNKDIKVKKIGVSKSTHFKKRKNQKSNIFNKNMLIDRMKVNSNDYVNKIPKNKVDKK